ncbi:MAG: ATP-binding protein [Paludibacteraceae bacterium]|nr:ATP-binding protein [Paludibacteraceae bacterium]
MNNYLFKIDLDDYSIAKMLSMVYETIKGRKLTKESLHLSAVDVVVEKLCDSLEMEEMEVALLSIVATTQGGPMVKIAKNMEMSWLEMADFDKYLRSLVEKKYLYKTQDDSVSQSYYLTKRAAEALMSNKPFKYVIPEELNATELAQYVMDTIRTYGSYIGEEKLKYCWDELEEVLQKNSQIKFATYVLREHDNYEDGIVLLWMIASSILQKRVCFGEHQMQMQLSKFDSLRYECTFSVASALQYLRKCGILEEACSKGMWDNESYSFTKTAADEIFADCNTKELLTFAEENLVKSSSNIAKMEMFYNAKEERQIERLAQLLEQSNLKKVMERLEKEGMRNGFTCLFYGAPGTGKTETVYQIARKTGRDLIVVDVAEIKSKWVGASEQRMRSLFAKYRKLVDNSQLTPILLFNEADAIIGIRKESANEAVDKMENALQNIILEEMESLKGIMIATTNLLANFDKAFERRFLYKIEFKKPEKEPMAKIWMSKMKDINEEKAKILAEKYPLSGGQIENICRKAKVEMILDDKSVFGYKDIVELCEEEVLNRKKSIGF